MPAIWPLRNLWLMIGAGFYLIGHLFSGHLLSFS